MINLVQESDQTKTSNLTKPKDYQNGRVDYFGILNQLNAFERNIYLNRYEALHRYSISIMNNGNNNMLESNFSTISEKAGFEHQRTFAIKGVSNAHFQLYYCTQSVADSAILFSKKNFVSLLNSRKGESQDLPIKGNIKSIDYDKGSGLIATTPSKKICITNIYQTELISKTIRMFNDEENISRCVFLKNRPGQTLLYAVGNEPNIVSWDPETEKSTAIFKGKENSNSIDFSQNMNLFGLAQDNKGIELFDERNPQNSIQLKGHLSNNFGIAFMNGSLLATSSEDWSIKIWDIRAPQNCLFAIQNKSPSYCIKFSKKLNKLFYLERMSCFKQIDCSLIDYEIETFSFIGFTAGFTLNTSETKAYISILNEGILEVKI